MLIFQRGSACLTIYNRRDCYNGYWLGPENWKLLADSMQSCRRNFWWKIKSQCTESRVLVTNKIISIPLFPILEFRKHKNDNIISIIYNFPPMLHVSQSWPLLSGSYANKTNTLKSFWTCSSYKVCYLFDQIDFCNSLSNWTDYRKGQSEKF